MPVRRGERDLIIGIAGPDGAGAPLCTSVSCAGGLGVLDLGVGDLAARGELKLALRATTAPIGIRVSAGCELSYRDFAEEFGEHWDLLDTVVLGWHSPWRIDEIPARVLVEVTSRDEARRAAVADADGVIARGNEAGGRASELGSFMLLQTLLSDDTSEAPRPPVWLCGGIGPRTAAAAVIGGAVWVVLDTQLASLSEENPFTDFGTVARSVAEVRGAIVDALRGEQLDALAPGSALARALGTELPVAQGPMTKVSDRAGFAASVAAHGALPFIALALSTQRQTRTVLSQTKAALGDRPWGVGVLGFAPEPVRAAQLAVIKEEVRPPVALIAGGHPGQARALEDVGVATFLHVASPVLLRQFLDAGTRRFVFEGAECGGHVGPLSSFALWQTQLDVLLDHFSCDESAADLQLLFAGGIHDARSAAMVSALAEPLTRRGAGIGVLMGTGYLFTEEAVRHGAVQPLFQRSAIAAETTALLETAPGHAIRCLPSPFAESFHAVRAQLIAAGTPSREVSAKLEELNVGRLRIASKGLRHDGADLVPVSEADQLVDGLFMAGQVATLRSSVTTVAQLHEGVTSDAVAFRAERGRRLCAELGIAAAAARPGPQPVDVAIVGMAGIFPGAPDLPGFWANIVGNVDAVTEVPRHRWDPEVYYARDGSRDAGRTPSKWGGFLGQIPFDALSYGLPPATLAAIEPVQLLALEVSARALADAGYADGGFDRARASVIFGAEAGSDLASATTLRTVLPGYVGELPAGLAEQLPTLTEDSFPGSLANVIAGRIANRLDLGGANYTVDAACASSLAALDVACKELVTNANDLVLCGGADLHNAVSDYLMFASVGALSPTGRCRTFDESADGIALGEGVACVVLKRLVDAERDGDRIYAVVKGVGAASDGKALGLTAPRPDGQRRALRRAYRNAGISPAEVGLLEAHGTGTVVGDHTELTILDEVFRAAGAAPGGCTLGSVKSQIGHTKCAAGLAGLIKAASAVHSGVVPPTAQLATPNAAWSPEASPFVFRDRAAPWLAPASERVAGVSAFGFGGTNFHVVLRGHASSELVRHGMPEWPVELFTIRGANQREVDRELAWLRGLIAANDANGRPWRLRDLAATAGARSDRGNAPVALAVVARNLDELGALLGAAQAGKSDPARGVFVTGRTGSGLADGKLAVLFCGQGSQRPGMLAELFVAFPELRRFVPTAGELTEAMFPPTAFGEATAREHEDRLRDTRLAQPALGVTGLAVHHLLSRLGIVPDMLAGHSYGELVALAAASCFDADTLGELSTARANAILACTGDDPGGMAAVAADPDTVRSVLAVEGLAAVVVLANHNAPRQVVISGPTAPLDHALRALRDAGVSAKKLRVGAAFHTPKLRRAGELFAETLRGTRIESPRLPVWANRTAAGYPRDADGVRAELVAQLNAPVRFVDQIEAMYADGARVFCEAGPSRVLGRLVPAILGDRPHVAVSCEGPAGSGLRGFLAAVAQLAVAGVDLRIGWLTLGRGAVNLDATRVPHRPGWTVDGQLVRSLDGQPLPGGLLPARTRTELAMPQEGTTGATGGARQALIAEYLRTSRELVAAQRDVLLRFLSAPIDAPVTTSNDIPTKPAEPQPVLEASAGDDVDALTTVVALIAERTGYPVELIEPDLDLEADLSVDSIKRTEIAAQLCAQLGTSAADPRFDELVRARTARAMADWTAAGTAEPEARTGADAEPSSRTAAPRRLRQQLVDAPDDTELVSLAGRHLVIVGADPELADALSTRLRAEGATTISTDGTLPRDEPFDGMILLHGLRADDEPVLPASFPVLREALRHDPRWLIAVAPSNPGPGAARAAGLRGLFRTIAIEYPDTIVRLVELDPALGLARLADLLVTELRTRAEAPVVLVDESRRRVFTLVDAELDATATDGDELTRIGLDADSVVLMVGGARGIAARFAGALAAGSGCRVELAGRTVLGGEPERAEIAAAADLRALRAALAALGEVRPAQIERSAREILAAREVRATLAALDRCGSQVRYHTVDVRDTAALRRLVKQLHAENGRIDAVIYAAGVISDRLIADKDPASFATVFGTKVDGCAALLAELAELPRTPNFVVLFGSIAAMTGNRGQADYAAGNDAMDTIGAEWAATTGGRLLTVHWGPWAPVGEHGGMVSAELARSYADRGIELIDPDAGVAGLISELANGPHDLRSIVRSATTALTEANQGQR